VCLGIEWNDNGFLTTAAYERQKCILLSLIDQTVQDPVLRAALECRLVPEDELRQLKGLRRRMPGRQAVAQDAEKSERVSMRGCHRRTLLPDNQNQCRQCNRTTLKRALRPLAVPDEAVEGFCLRALGPRMEIAWPAICYPRGMRPKDWVIGVKTTRALRVRRLIMETRRTACLARLRGWRPANFK